LVANIDGATVLGISSASTFGSDAATFASDLEYVTAVGTISGSDDAGEGDAYTNFGILKSEQVIFDGDGNDFKKWIKTNMSGTSIGRCI
jgi:hypothetical protein